MAKVCALIGIGANVSGVFGPPLASLRTATAKLAEYGITLTSASSLYQTRPISQGYQPDYLNAALAVEVAVSPVQLLRRLKRLEQIAGRTNRGRNRSRPLDLDILDFRGQVLNWQPDPSIRRPPLVLPHPELHRRLFALVPLAEVAPTWQHPVLHATARRLAIHLGGKTIHGDSIAVRRHLDSSWIS